MLDFDRELINFRSENGSPLHSAISGTKSFDTVKFLFDRMTEEEISKVVNAPDQSGVTPLFLATYTGHEDVVQMLVDRGADPTRSY